MTEDVVQLALKIYFDDDGNGRTTIERIAQLLEQHDAAIHAEGKPCTGCVHVDDNTEPENCLQCIRMTREDFYTIKEDPK